MTRRREPAVLDVGITPRTQAGTGLSVPIAKALAHLWLVHEAVTRAWPLTLEAASAEVGEAITHLRDLRLPETLLTDNLIEAVHNWSANLTPYGSELVAASLTDPEASLTDDQKNELRGIVRNTWTLLALVDREITGIESPANADPGTMP